MSNVFDQSGEKSAFIVARYRAEFNDADYDERNVMLDQIAHAASGGSGRALELLLELLDVHQLASPIVRKLIIDDGMAEEAIQDVLVAVASSVSKFRAESKFSTWFHALARNTAVGYLRRRRPDSLLEDSSNVVGAERRVSSIVAERAAVRSSVEQLPQHYRDAVLLRDVEHLSYEQVAERLGIELNTVRSRLARGRAMLASIISEPVVDG